MYHSFPVSPHLRMNFLEEFLVEHKLKLLSDKVHPCLIRNSTLGHSQITKNTKKCLYPCHSQLVPSSFISHSQMAKNSAPDHSSSKVSNWILTTSFLSRPIGSTGAKSSCQRAILPTNHVIFF
jgi:hypothetical protein